MKDCIKTAAIDVWDTIMCLQNEVCTNPGLQVARATEFFMVARNISGSFLWNLRQVNFLAPRILKQILFFFMFAPLYKSVILYVISGSFCRCCITFRVTRSVSIAASYSWGRRHLLVGRSSVLSKFFPDVRHSFTQRGELVRLKLI